MGCHAVQQEWIQCVRFFNYVLALTIEVLCESSLNCVQRWMRMASKLMLTSKQECLGDQRASLNAAAFHLHQLPRAKARRHEFVKLKAHFHFS
jgi:hypothetical protein